MDLCSIHVKNEGAFLLSNPILRRPIFSWNLRSMMGASCGNLRFLEIRVSEAKPFLRNQAFVVKAIGKKKNNSSNDSENSNSNSSSSRNGNHSNGEGNSHKGSNPSQSNKNKDVGSQKSHPKPLNWREFRAALYTQEQAELAVSDTANQDHASSGSKSFPQKWAHPISAPENGCLLVATEKLDGVHPFERTVILLLRAGSGHPEEGPFGIIINRPHHKRIKHLKPTNLVLQTTFSECPVHFGGPLEASMFLLRTGERLKLLGIEEIIPGLSFGARNSLEGASTLVKKGVLKLQDFRFFIGYAGWKLEQLREEIDSGFWCVAACSSSLLFGTSHNSSPESLWKEILQLMGGHYSELSRKPKQDT